MTSPSTPSEPSESAEPTEPTESSESAAATPQPAGPAALVSVVRELEQHASQAGWDRPASLFALVSTAQLIAREPGLVDVLDGDEGLTPVQQEELPAEELETLLQQIVWPPDVDGVAAVVERLVLPPAADDEIPDDPAAAAAYAAEHPDRQEVRMVVGVTRAGASYCALRLRAHDDDQSVVGGTDLVPELVALLATTLDTDPDDEDDE